MSLTIEEVSHIANLARLELSEDELNRFRGQLSTILDYFQQLESLDTAMVPPTASVSAGQTPLRTDQTRSGLSLSELLHNAPESDERLFRVPPIFE
ncbi:Asp-tRNA(Asn)/Glu-tRNA(Gln) amidotransferase subunit GatC [Chloroflexota bacterium]